MAFSSFQLKYPTGWLAAGEGFQKALQLLSDPGFKLFAHLSLQACRVTGCVLTTPEDLAKALNKSKEAIDIIIDELRERGVCSVRSAKKQPHYLMSFLICDEYWSYKRDLPVEMELGNYVAAIRESFLALECTAGKFGGGDVRKAMGFEKCGIPLETVQDALLTGACRKLTSWLDGRMSAPIGSLAYFEDIVLEMEDHPLPPGYREYLNMQVKKLALIWKQQLWMKQMKQKTDSPSVENESF
jgi:hypothetical protein